MNIQPPPESIFNSITIYNQDEGKCYPDTMVIEFNHKIIPHITGGLMKIFIKLKDGKFIQLCPHQRIITESDRLELAKKDGII